MDKSKEWSHLSMNFIKFAVRDKANVIEKKNENFEKYLAKLQKHRPLKTTFWEFFKSHILSFCQIISGSNGIKESQYLEKTTKKLARLKKATYAIKEKLDVSYVLKKFYELDKLKMLLLNEDQYHLFEFASKPVVLRNAKIHIGNSKKSVMGGYENDAIGKAKKMYKAYQNIRSQGQASGLDGRLIELLDDNLRNIFEVFV